MKIMSETMHARVHLTEAMQWLLGRFAKVLVIFNCHSHDIDWICMHCKCQIKAASLALCEDQPSKLTLATAAYTTCCKTYLALRLRMNAARLNPITAAPASHIPALVNVVGSSAFSKGCRGTRKMDV